MTIHFVTSNSGKVKSMQQHLVGLDITVKQVKLPLVEPQANTVEEVARSKARQAFELLKEPVVVEDSAFCIDELQGFPGPYAKYILETIGIDGILKLTESLTSRSCHFESVLVYIDASGKGKVFTEHGATGTLATEVAPMNTDEAWSELWRIFIPAGATKPLSILEGAEREKIQTRWQARSKFRQFGEWLKGQGVGA